MFLSTASRALTGTQLIHKCVLVSITLVPCSVLVWFGFCWCCCYCLILNNFHLVCYQKTCNSNKPRDSLHNIIKHKSLFLQCYLPIKQQYLMTVGILNKYKKLSTNSQRKKKCLIIKLASSIYYLTQICVRKIKSHLYQLALSP